jgi:hypothetical protein
MEKEEIKLEKVEIKIKEINNLPFFEFFNEQKQVGISIGKNFYIFSKFY